ncbi:hypothetical protein CEUSTIGMA_g4526.t1 [Chlamydomonas eustigma]|uniref:Inositol-1-monophosphatase n=1 Tax=Chlamydomonas eustigma TaxID=1157962 RepID=A0A250X2U4_9CHLO|nr:hypothetical protein CEUSTIGMA_g4526.t1 [Chlamydomonas eustigma]|eukprot:GAX77080.1 hypothetical protein CEUSTIGMA_g4526.t1 [Chlamydomonas eustigma]
MQQSSDQVLVTTVWSYYENMLFTRCMASMAAAADVTEPEDLMKIAQQAASAGAQVVLEALDKPRLIKLKGALDLVTETDVASEKAVLEVLKRHCPHHAVLGEEGGVSGDPSSGYLWCVDPLDGTTNFAHQYPAFAVSVGVMKGLTPVAGCVVEFAGGPGTWVTRTYTASLGGGAMLNGRTIKTSSVTDIEQSLLVTGFGYDHGAAWALNMEFFKYFTDKARGVRRLGAASVDLCHVACGMAESYWEYLLKPWDTCAGVIILTEAGGKVTTLDGQLYSPFHRSLLASNGGMHARVLEVTACRTKTLSVECGVDLSPWLIPDGYDAFGLKSY